MAEPSSPEKSSNANETQLEVVFDSAKRRVRRRVLAATIWLAAVALLCVGSAGWLGFKATTIRTELEAATQLIPILKKNIAGGDSHAAMATAEQLRSRTAAARVATDDPLWTLASAMPMLGANFSAVTEVARSADDVSTLGVAPLVKVFDSLNWDRLLPSSGRDKLGAAASGFT